MTEKILEVNELSDVKANGETSYSWETFDGYEIVTTEQRIRLLMGMDTSCCETPGYFLSEDNPKDFIGSELRGVSLTNTALETTEVELAKELGTNESRYDDGGCMFVNIETDRGVLQFVAYNVQNGYYGHTARIESRQLTHEERL